MEYDATVVGSGPNGLAAAIELARAGCSVCVFEMRSEPGGGVRTAELTLPGFLHDVCSAVHPLGVGSPFFRTLPLAKFGLEWIHPAAPLAHPLDDGTAVFAERSLDATASQLGADSSSYQKIFGRFAASWDELAQDVLGPIHIPRHPFLLADFGRYAIQPADSFVHGQFSGERARALLGGIAAHSLLPLDRRPTAAFGLLLGILAHAVGWPLPKGGSRSITNALISHLASLGGIVCCGVDIRSIDELPSSRMILCDVTPRQLLKIAGSRLDEHYQRKLRRYRYGVGVFKVDWALASPIPWKDPACLRAGTVHVGGTFEDMKSAESEIAHGKHPERPLVILAQPSLFDPTRAPAGNHTAWGYCHVPHGSTVDMTNVIENQIERMAPGFRDCVIQRHTFNTSEFEAYNPNYVGGDINGGVQDLGQVIARPVASLSPYRTPAKGLYICSSSTPPGGGVHGMCGYHAARTALADMGV
jgi:phytoene dehydrogenase-like protein